MRRTIWLCVAFGLATCGCKPSAAPPVVLPPPVAAAPAPVSPAPVQPGPPAPPPVEELSKVIERLDNGVVYIISTNVLGQETGFGTGFVIDKSGLVMTNYHVVRNAYSLTLQNREGKPLELAGYRAVDRKRDVVILQLKDPPSDLEAFTFGQPDQIRSGEEVVAIGHPQGFRFTTTTGIVSAVRKTKDLPRDYRFALQSTDDTQWIQTSTAISSGSSGGPLLNRRGQVIGINTWLAFAGQNLGFATHLQHLTDLKNNLAEVQPLPVKRSQAYLDVADAQVARLVMDFTADLQKYMADNAQRARNPIGGLFGGGGKNPSAKHAAKLWEAAEAERKSPRALEALSSIATVAAYDPEKCEKELKQALARIREDHLADTRLDKALIALRHVPHEAAHEFLREVAQTHSDRELQGLAWLALADSLLKTKKPLHEPGMYDLEIADALAKTSRDYGDIDLDGQSLKDMTEKLHFMVTGLMPGRRLPELKGKDVDGQEIDLASYRGKVVVLDFWVDWCPYCREMYAQEHALLNRHRDRPFAIVGVNSDQEGRYRQLLASKTVSWPSIYNGPEGELTTKWNVASYPTMYLVDREGVVRTNQIVKDAQLDATIDMLLDAPCFTWPQNLVKNSDTWAYHDGETTPPENWYADGFDQAGWKSAAAPFGYGLFDEKTRLDYGSDPKQKRTSAYFRRAFEVTDAANVRDLVLSLKCDDGAIVYLNGQEAARSLVAARPGKEPKGVNSAYNTWRYERVVSIDPKLLKQGTNVMAVQVLQESPTSSDLYFDCSLSSNVVEGLTQTVRTGVVSQKGDAVQALGYLGAIASSAAADIESLLQHEDALLRVRALESLLLLAPDKVPSELPEPKSDEEKRFRAYACGRLNNYAWLHCIAAGLSPAEYEMSVRFSNAGTRIQPKEMAVLGTRGMAYFRCGKLDEAAVDIAACNAQRDHTINVLIEAMIQHQQGKADAAKPLLEKARNLSTSGRNAVDPDLKLLLEEANAMIDPKGS